MLRGISRRRWAKRRSFSKWKYAADVASCTGNRSPSPDTLFHSLSFSRPRGVKLVSSLLSLTLTPRILTPK